MASKLFLRPSRSHARLVVEPVETHTQVTQTVGQPLANNREEHGIFTRLSVP